MDRLLRQLFVMGFYNRYSGLFLLIGLLFVGMCPPGKHLEVYINIAAAASTHWVFAVLTIILSYIYLYLVLNHILSTYYEDPYSFLRHSFTAKSKNAQIRSWIITLFLTGFPIISFISTGVLIGYATGHLLFPSILLLAVAAAFAFAFLILRRFTDPLHLMENSNRIGNIDERFGSSYVALGARYLLSVQRVPYLIAKLLAYVFVNVLMFVYADIQHHQGVIMLILTSIVLGHSVVVAGQFLFEQRDMVLWRNLPVNKFKRWAFIFCRLIVLFFPEAVWLLYRYPSINSILFLCYMWSLAFFMYHFFFLISPTERYITWFFFLFFILVILSPLATLTPLILIFLLFSLVVHINFVR